MSYPCSRDQTFLQLFRGYPFGIPAYQEAATLSIYMAYCGEGLRGHLRPVARRNDVSTISLIARRLPLTSFPVDTKDDFLGCFANVGPGYSAGLDGFVFDAFRRQPYSKPL